LVTKLHYFFPIDTPADIVTNKQTNKKIIQPCNTQHHNEFLSNETCRVIASAILISITVISSFECFCFINNYLISVSTAVNATYREEIVELSNQRRILWGYIYEIIDLHEDICCSTGKERIKYKIEWNALLSDESLSKMIKSTPKLSEAELVQIFIKAGVYEKDVYNLVSWLLQL
jgi:hypothetical protein